MAEIRIDSVIGSDADGWEVSAKWFAEQLAALPRGEPITLRINSPGGDVFEAHDIYNQIARWPGKTTAAIESIAASAATNIMLAATEIEIAENGMVMIHEGMRFGYGWHNKTEIRRMADKDTSVLQMIDDGLAKAYAARSGKKTAEEFHQAMIEETWLNAQQAVEWGLADRIGQPLKVKACVPKTWFTKTPPDLLDNEAEAKNRAMILQRMRAKIQIARAKTY